MPRIIVFDVSETLLDVRALEPHFRRVFGEETVLREWFSLLLHSQVATLAFRFRDARQGCPPDDGGKPAGATRRQ